MKTYTYFEHISEINTHLTEEYFFWRYLKRQNYSSWNNFLIILQLLYTRNLEETAVWNSFKLIKQKEADAEKRVPWKFKV